ncbi:MAG: hypoxanthine phosphoribosyltransferase [Synergistaceae bacterium]|nr:hypoxanthine phosphoribosyltransferase [Synergistaceae bacterium]MBQ7570270.1 hypoxanthine phosphoribosyltransferase [Synergistaceae bacterium]MBQ9582477.1 hypoxanthine phosphoribosyltransferase [Synergistaceae bacterium]MBQ9897815.1 hypoxanthine phosphoribosyltransferase [Synergistaceae bacterium]MBR0044833.1 hypoxanthine phosphoribosyltransferase [Synergistaceae bacterium]
MSEYKLGEVIMPREVIAKRVKELADQIANDLNKQEVLVVGILTGASLFLTDLVREMPEDMDVRIDFMSVSSYMQDTTTSGVVRILHDIKTSIEGKNVLVVEDIIDSGLTLNYLLKLLQSRKPAILKTCVLLDKPSRRKTEVKVDYVGFEIPDEFVVGYGLDYAGKWRHLKDIRNVNVVEI